MTEEPRLRRRALLPGVAASIWADRFAVGIVAAIVVLVVVGVSAQPWAPFPLLLRGVGVVAGVLVVALAIVSGTMVLVRLTAERRQGYTTIDGFRLGAGVDLIPGSPDTVDTVDARTGVVLRDAGDLHLDPAVLAARIAAARARRRAGERPILLDPLR